MATKMNGEILVNTTTSGSQGYQSTTALAGGGFVVVWQDESATGGDASGAAIRGQIFNAAGAKSGAEFLVNTTTAGGQFAPSVEEIPGGFVVAWEDASNATGDSGGRGIVSQRFDLSGAKLGGEVLVNTTTATDQTSPDITYIEGSNYVVAWVDASQSGGDTSGSAVRGQVFAPNGAKVGGEFLINTTTSNAQQNVDIAAKGPNGFVAVWQDLSRSPDDPDNFAVRGQRFSLDGDKIGAEFLVNTTTALSQGIPSVHSFSDASFIVVWRDFGGANDTIRAQRFTNLGVKSGSEFVISGPDAGFKGALDVTTLSNGGFAVVFQDSRATGPDASETSIWLQEYSSTNAKVGAEVLVNTTTAGAQGNPDIEQLTDGRLVVTWEDFSGTGGDTSSRAVRAQLFALGADSGGGATAGNDVLSATAGSPSVFGGLGNDTISANNVNNSYLRGDEGDDSIVGGSGFDDINGNMGNDTIVLGSADSWAVGGKDNDSLMGGAGQNLVYGNLGNDTCDGGGGNDIVRGGQDNDVVRGGAGDDFVSGDKGDDTMTGGTGADIFHSFGDAGLDRVTDFLRSEGDRVLLDPGSTYTVAQVGADTVVSITGGGQMILVGVSMSSLTGAWITVG